MEDEEAVIETLAEEFEGTDSEAFEVSVERAAGDLAHNVNCNGIGEQIKFLIQNGYTEEQIRVLADG